MLAEIFRLRLEATAPAAEGRNCCTCVCARPTVLRSSLRPPSPRRWAVRPRGGVLLASRSSSSPSPRSIPNLARTRATIIARGAATGRGTRPTSRSSRPPGRARSATREKSSSTSSGKSGKSQAKSEASSSQASRTRSVRQEPPPSKSSGRANASVRRESPAGGGSTPPPAPPAQPSDPSAHAAAQAPSSARVGSTPGDSSTRSSARCSRRGLTSSLSSRTSRVQPKHRLRARATRKSPELARMRRAAMSALAPLLADCRAPP